MSRPLGTLLVLLALWVQFLAPIAAAQAVPGADTPLASTPICGHAPDAGADGQPGHAGPACGLCCATVAVLDATPPSPLAVALAWTVLAFMAPPTGAADAAAPDLARARDPPANA